MTPKLDRYTLEKAAEIAGNVTDDLGLSDELDQAQGAMAVRDALRALASTLPKEPAVPEGWKLVPVEPTPEMCARGFCVSEAEHDPGGVYRAMLAAAPSGKEKK